MRDISRCSVELKHGNVHLGDQTPRYDNDIKQPPICRPLFGWLVPITAEGWSSESIVFVVLDYLVESSTTTDD